MTVMTYVSAFIVIILLIRKTIHHLDSYVKV